MSQHKVGEWVWLEAKYLTLPYASAKLAPKCHSPFRITKDHLLMPYKETPEHRAQFQCPPPELIGNEEEYKVEQIINH